MEQFKIRQGGFKEIRKTMIIKAIPTLLLIACVGLAMGYFNPSVQQSDVNVLPFVIPLVLGALAFGMYLGVNRQKKIFETYILTFDSSSITREQHNTPTISIPHAELSEIIKNPNGDFTIKGNSIVEVIGVPAQIDDYEKLERLLSGIKPILTKSNEPFLQKFRLLISILTVGLMAGVYISKDKMIVGVSGTVLLLILGYSFFEVH